ncbi:MAG TPA: hypothetical protein VFB72_18480 [Verrucomicrobiae bacterium]|nr:hypothetical protein [Verrucomicrobiae bacterium]
MKIVLFGSLLLCLSKIEKHTLAVRILLFAFVVTFLAGTICFANPSAEEDARREQAIADYTQKMQQANYPALFAKAAQEFNVPSDVLMAVSFAETRWTQLQWPPGETVSPENGMPHPYGIMSLWDNDYFGHTLRQAAQLIGQDPEMLKTDAFQNMRGGAALLRKLYDQTPKPADAPNENQIESWRYAIAKYTGIPQPDLSQGHALRVYEYMNLGYHQYGIEWNGHPVNLAPMREDVARIIAAVRAEKNPVAETNATMSIAFSLPKEIPAPILADAAPELHPIVPADNSAANRRQRWYLAGLMVVLLAIAFWYLRHEKRIDGTNR